MEDPSEAGVGPAQGDSAAANAPVSPAREERTRVWIHSAALSVICFLLVMYTMYLAASLLIPITLAFLLAVVLSPAARLMVRVGIPQTVAALLLMLGLAAASVAGIYAVADPAIDWAERAPSELRKIESKLSWVTRPIEELQEAGKQVESMADVGGNGDDSAAANGPSFSLTGTLLNRAPNVLYGVAVTFILLFFTLSSGDAFLRKAVQVTPGFRDKKRVVDTGRDIQRHVSTYLGTIAAINLGVGVAVAAAMFLLDMPSPILWGVTVGILNFIPYIGVLMSMIIVTFVALLTFETAGQIVAPAAAIFAINVIEGQFLTPIITGRRLSLSPVAVFLSLVIMGWMWSVVGVLLAVPLLAVVKLVCDEIEPLQPIGTFLGRP